MYIMYIGQQTDTQDSDLLKDTAIYFALFKINYEILFILKVFTIVIIMIMVMHETVMIITVYKIIFQS